MQSWIFLFTIKSWFFDCFLNNTCGSARLLEVGPKLFLSARTWLQAGTPSGNLLCPPFLGWQHQQGSWTSATSSSTTYRVYLCCSCVPFERSARHVWRKSIEGGALLQAGSPDYQIALQSFLLIFLCFNHSDNRTENIIFFSFFVQLSNLYFLRIFESPHCLDLKF